MSEEQRRRPYSEKQEKQEKEEEKQEKSWDEKWRRDPLNAAAWALILIWAGLVLLASNIGVLRWIEILDAWPLFFLGAGIILLVEAAIRLIVPAYRGPVIGNIVLALIFLGIALGGLINWGLIWAFVLIAIGVAILLRGLFFRRE
ncbi:MAG: LiaF transmembrane domain-containing protein [Anaerolineae bacterium]